MKINQLVLRCLNKYPKPTDMAASIVPAIRNQLRELRHVNNQVARMCAGWLDRAEG
ncbi:MAG TPA: hypothetical protein VNQ14_13080 [Woeseiaceae bacterium]|nr:hypothetical protein [Woeseiaceae bacterium]